MLLTSGGLTTDDITAALEELLDKPVSEASAVLVPTALYAMGIGVDMAGTVIRARGGNSLAGAGWGSLGVLELTALPSLEQSVWLPALGRADAVLVEGGDPLFLHHWMVASGLADLLPDLDLVYVGLSAGSMVVTPRIGTEFVGWTPPGHPGAGEPGHDTTLGLVDFSIFPHLDNPDLPGNTLAAAEEWAGGVGGPSYLLDDLSALVVTGERGAQDVRVLSQGQWHQR
ncbi:Type 1 glutamine amidotransferase-like domain-containing protein [Nocardioides bruguierae]|uniref:Type 1 glutamine amidotransferase-like domain-containing protein n=1 Tax=Nocardioides bruguierae TaxID=2945102 RepID=UPI002022381D|nr:Type 1 glutamine amidotransferase-like domain-containing protein [Nocardioides bruguierae]MCL8026377.1 Type 1 glutamine amidotransferase-like domain-containing protein [Nocardioides bruguierae]